MRWPKQNTPYLSALPGVGGPGLDVTNGDLPSKMYFVDSRENVKEGGPAPELGPNCFRGTPWWCWYADQGAGFSKWIWPMCSGYAYLGRAMNSPETPNFDYVGHAAPGAGLFFQTADMRVRSSNSRIWHAASWLGDLPSVDGPDKFQADQRDCFGASASDTSINRVIHINCEGRWSMDETSEVWYDALGVAWVRSAIYDPLHVPPDFAMPDGSHHEAGVDHGYGHLIGGRADYSLVMQSLYAHTTGRNPLVAAPNHAHINNLHYNHGRPYIGRGEALHIDDNSGSNADQGLTMQCNCVGNVTVRGPEQGDSLTLALVDDVTPGSSGHSALNSQFGWARPASQADFFKDAPPNYLKSVLRKGAWPLGLGFDYAGVFKPARDPLNPTVQEGLRFSQLMREQVGMMPARRYLYRSGVDHVLDQIDAAIRGVPFTGPQYVNTVEESGGWPDVPTLTLDPRDPNDQWWHAPLPLGADRDEVGADGYSNLRRWVIRQDEFVRGR
jgi:hypothetical protein